MNGKFISIEGIEGVGKSTQLVFIEKYLRQQGKKVIITREPGGTSLGEDIRKLLIISRTDDIMVDTELLLIFAARAEHVAQVIKPSIRRGDWVVSDRFVDATFAYQGGGRGMSTDRIQKITDWTLSGFKPDITFLLDLPVKYSQQRVIDRNNDIDRFEREKTHFFKKVRDCYLQRSRKEPDRIMVIDASKIIDNIQKQLISHLSRLILN